MNELNSTSILPRLTGQPLVDALAKWPVTVVTGARQTGKTTLVRAIDSGESRTYLTLDRADVLEQANSVPDQLVERAEHITLDEVQRAPELLMAVKRAVDENRRPGRFLLTGSANLLLMSRVAETLAGRAIYITLYPLTRREQLGFGSAGDWSMFFDNDPIQWPGKLASTPCPYESWRDLCLRGGYPTPSYELEVAADRQQWFDSFARTYIERDLRDLATIDRTTDIRRLMEACALRVGGILNQADLARDIGLAPTTTQRYLRLLDVSYQLLLVPSFSVNRTKRLVKSPRLYWSDCGLALHLAGENEPRGPHFENLVALDILAWASVQPLRPRLCYWRTTKGAEVDFVIEWGRHVLPLEVKSSKTVRQRDAKHVRTFLEEYSDLASAGLVLYDGEETYWLAEKVLAVPWWKII